MPESKPVSETLAVGDEVVSVHDKRLIGTVTAVVPVDDVAEQKRLLERDRIRADRKKAIRVRRDEEIRHRLSGVLLDATKKVGLRQHAFKSDEELQALKLKPHEIRLVRQWEEAKRNAAYALESSSKQIEAHLRTTAESKGVQLNIGNVEKVVLQLPEKEAETAKPVIIEVVPESK